MKRPTTRRAFTLVEVLVTCALLAVLLVLLLPVFDLSTRSLGTASKQAEVYTKARLALDLIGADLAGMRSGRELPSFTEPAPQIDFFTTRTPVRGGPADLRGLTRVVHRVDDGAFELQRGETSVTFGNSPTAPSATLSMAPSDFDTLATGVVAFAAEFISENSDVFSEFVPEGDPTRSPSRFLRATIAVLDAQSLALCIETGAVSRIQSALAPASPSSWRDAAEALSPDLPAPVRGRLLVTSRIFPIPSN